MRWLASVFDSADTRTEVHDLLCALGFVFLAAYQGYALWQGQQFDPAALGEAFGIVLGGGAVSAFGAARLRASRSPVDLPTDKDGLV